jgi:adenosine deaminase
MYLRYDVPVAISTDDEGVSRSNMTEQYLRAVRHYRLSYPTLKKIVRNSLEYSFIPGQSLWKDASYSQFATSCATQHAETNNVSSSCRDFLKNNQKARLQWELEADFGRFEAKSCCIAAPNQAHSVR